MTRKLLFTLVLAATATRAGAELTGRVLAADGQPVAGAAVTAYAPESAEARVRRITQGLERPALVSAKAMADGSFVLPTAEAVTTVLVRADGFAPAFTTGLQREPLTVHLEPAASHRGTVMALGKPVFDAVVAWRPSAEADEMLVTRTARDGTYEVVGTPYARITLNVLHRDFVPVSAWGNPLSRSTFDHDLEVGLPLTGRALDERTGRGLAGVTIWMAGWPRAESGKDGTFTIPHAAPDWTVLGGSTDTLLGKAKRGPGPLILTLKPARRLSGVVRDAHTKQPLPGALVSVSARDEPSPSVLTDARGQYELPSLAPSRYSAAVTRPGYEPRYLGGQAAQMLDLGASATLRHDFELAPRRRVTGRVLDQRAQPVEGALVMVGVQGAGTPYGPGVLDEMRGHRMDGGQTAEAPVRSARDGSFVINLPDGLESLPGGLKLQLVALGRGYPAGTAPLPPPASQSPVVITLSQGIALSGRVRSEDGAPLAGVAIALGETGPLAGLRPGAGPMGQREWTRSDAAGRFAIPVQPLLHQLAFRKPGYAPRIVEGFDPRRGEELVVVLQRGAEIRGQVLRHEGSGVDGASVVVQDALEAQVASSATEADGSFSIADLVPGSYVLVVSTEEGVSVTRPVEAPAADVRVQLGPTTVVRGRVIDAVTRLPVSRFEVSVKPAAREGDNDAPDGYSEKFSTDDGVFELEHVAPGETVLSVHAEGYRPHVTEGLLLTADAEALPLEVALDPGLALRGRVTSNEGGVLADVVVVASSGGSHTTTDEHGDYELKALAPGEVALHFRKTGYRPEKRTLQVQQGARVDVTLSRGLSLRGVVVAEDGGAGIADVQVQASSSASGAETQTAATDQAGRFTVPGLAPGRYEVTASKDEYGSAEIQDVDAATAGPLRLVLKRSPTAILSGTVSGLGGDEARPPTVMVFVVDEEGSDLQYGIADVSGSFRIEKAPAGRVTVTGRADYPDGRTRSSVSKDLMLPQGVETTTVLEFRDDLVVSGTVVRSGLPVRGATVTFQAQGSAGSASRTDAEGRYQVTLVPETYQVGVIANGGASYHTQYVAVESGTLDIDMTGATLRGRVVEVGTDTPVTDAAISVWAHGGTETSPTTSLQSGAQGTFEASLEEGRYQILAARKGYGQQVREVELVRGVGADVLFELQPAEGVTVTVADARDNRTLEAIVVVRDLARRIVANGHAGADKEGAVTIPLSDGPYLLSVSANNYGTVTTPITAPARGLRIGLTPGGTLVVESPRNLRGIIRLRQPNGEEYVRCWCNGIAEITLEGRRTAAEHITPGRYTLELADASQGAPQPVTITEGAVTTVTIE